MSQEQNQAQGEGPVGFANYLEQLKSRRNEYIDWVDRVTRLIDFIESHPECQEFLKLADEMQSKHP